MTLKILDGEFFEVKETKGDHVLAECVKCKKLVRGNKFSSSNFRSHLKRHHGDSMLTAYENRVKDRLDDSDSSSDHNDISESEEKNHQQCTDEEDSQTEEDSRSEDSVSDSEMPSNVETDDSSTSTHCCHCRKELNRRTLSRTNYCPAKKRDILDNDLSKFRVVEDDSGYPRRFFIRVDK